MISELREQHHAVPRDKMSKLLLWHSPADSHEAALPWLSRSCLNHCVIAPDDTRKVVCLCLSGSQAIASHQQCSEDNSGDRECATGFTVGTGARTKTSVRSKSVANITNLLATASAYQTYTNEPCELQMRAALRSLGVLTPARVLLQDSAHQPENGIPTQRVH